MVWPPAVLSTTFVNVCDPALAAVKAKLAGKPVARTSVLLRSTVPRYWSGPVAAMLPNGSSAVTVTVPTEPATSGLAKLVVTTNWLAGAGLTTIGSVGGEVRLVPLAVVLAVSAIDPLVSLIRLSNAASPSTAETVTVPLKVPAEPLARAAVTGPSNDVTTLP